MILSHGIYNVSTPTTEALNAIKLKSNVSIRGLGDVTLKLTPNNLSKYAIVHIESCDNVKIENINIVGDKSFHLGTSGTWGMGLNIIESTNVQIDNVTAEECWVMLFYRLS